jgi:lipid II:glycine glycyltransferase (peptidoglycan interpeptide bridge formation enzyme)
MNSLVDVRQTPQYARFMKKLGWKIEKFRNSHLQGEILKHLGGGYIFIKKLPLLPFSIAKILKSPYVPNLNELRKIIKKYRCLFIKLQPFVLKNKISPHYSLLITHYSKDNHPLIPTKTIWIDLAKSKKQLFKNFHKKIRYSIRFAKKKGVKTKIIPGSKITEKNLIDFYNIWSKNKPFNWLFKPNFNELKHLVDSFNKDCFFVFAKHKNKLVSAMLVLNSKNMAFDWIGASTKKGRSLLAKSLVVWKAIGEAKKRELKIFDFEGIYDPRFAHCQKGWKGFTHFKKGFGGKEVSFTHPLIFFPPSVFGLSRKAGSGFARQHLSSVFGFRSSL